MIKFRQNADGKNKEKGKNSGVSVGWLVAAGHRSSCRSKDADSVAAAGGRRTAVSCRLLSPGGGERGASGPQSEKYPHWSCRGH